MGQVYVISTINFALWTMEAIWKKKKLFLTEKDYRRKKKVHMKNGKIESLIMYLCDDFSESRLV